MDSIEENQILGTRFAEDANDYLIASRLLWQSLQEHYPNKTLRFGPLLMCLSHSLELSMKSALMQSGVSIGRVLSYGHDLEKIYNTLTSNENSKAHIRGAEKHVQTKWKNKLRHLRDEKSKRYVDFPGTNDPDVLRQLDIPTNQDIAESLPVLRETVTWLGDRHKSKGSEFRYTQIRGDCVSTNVLSGKPFIPDTIIWACEFWADELKKTPPQSGGVSKP